MPPTVDALALVVAAAGLASVLVAVMTTGRWRAGLAVAFDLWLAAGLLRLSGAPGWGAIAAVAATVAVRRLVLVGLGRPAGRPTAG